jgi:hypothetical protein
MLFSNVVILINNFEIVLKICVPLIVIHHVAHISEALHEALMAVHGQDGKADLILHTDLPSNFRDIKTWLLS